MDSQGLQNRCLVGAAINRFREEQGLSLRKLAHMVGMDYAYICSIEGGKANPTLDVLSKIASGLDVEIVELFTRSDRGPDYAMSKLK